MSLFRVIEPFLDFKKGDVLLCRTVVHWCVVKVGSATNKTEYTKISAWDYPQKEWLLQKLVEPLLKYDIRKLANHMTWRMWRLHGTFECRDKWPMDYEMGKGKVKLLPALMCYDCMKEGNPFLTKKPPLKEFGLCKICQTEKPLHNTIHAWPVDFRSNGYGFTVIGTGKNFDLNVGYYRKNFIVDF